jgi:hypothetical protein
VQCDERLRSLGRRRCVGLQPHHALRGTAHADSTGRLIHGDRLHGATWSGHEGALPSMAHTVPAPSTVLRALFSLYSVCHTRCVIHCVPYRRASTTSQAAALLRPRSPTTRTIRRRSTTMAPRTRCTCTGRCGTRRACGRIGPTSPTSKGWTRSRPCGRGS